MRRLLTSVVVALGFVSCASAWAANRYQNNGDLLRTFGLPPSLGLILRDSNGERISRAEFFRKINNGTPFFQDGVVHIQRAVFTLGSGYNIEQPPSGQVTKLKVGDPMPPFHDIATNGVKVSNQFFANRLTVVDFFGVDCGACIAEIPVLNAFKAEHPRIQTLAVTMDAAEYVDDLVKRTSFKWPVAPDAINLVQSVGVWFAPTYALVDQHGRLLAATSASSLHAPGKELSSADIENWVEHYQAPDFGRH